MAFTFADAHAAIVRQEGLVAAEVSQLLELLLRSGLELLLLGWGLELLLLGWGLELLLLGARS